MKRLAFLLLASLLLGGQRLAAAQAAAISREEYRALVAACRQAAAAKTPSPERTGTLSRRLRAVRRVTLAGGRQIVVNNDEPARLLAEAPRSRTARAGALARLETLHALLAPPQASPAARNDPRQQAVDILGGAEFRRAAAAEAAEEKPEKKSWWDRWLENLGRSIARFFEKLFGSLPRGPVSAEGVGTMGEALRFVLYFLVGVAAVAALYLLARTLRGGGGARRRPARAGGPFTGNGDDAIVDPLAAARASAHAGDYRAALRLTYLACLRRLQGAGLLVLEQDKTNWEYQRALRSRAPEAHDALLPVTRDFDRVWYGEMPATPEEYERALRAHDALPEPVAAGEEKA